MKNTNKETFYRYGKPKDITGFDNSAPIFIWEGKEETVFVGYEPYTTDFEFRTWEDAIRYVENEGYEFKATVWV